MSRPTRREGPPGEPELDGNAVVYCEGAFGTLNGKTAHGLVRFTRRYRVVAVVDSRHAGEDAGEVLDKRHCRIPIVASLDEAVAGAAAAATPATHLVIGLAPDGGRLAPAARADVAQALEAGLHVDSGLHDFLSDDPELAALASSRGVVLRDARKPPPRNELHFFSGKIAQVTALRVAVLGTDSAVGKRTTAWKLVQALEATGIRAELVGTGQTAWLQGARYCLPLDSLINDFVTGEIEHAVYRAFSEGQAEVIVVEGQGGLLNPGYPGGYEILAAARPAAVVLQHAPARRDYDGFPGFPIHPLARQIEAVEVLSDAPVVAITVNHENLEPGEAETTCRALENLTGLVSVDPLVSGARRLVEALRPLLPAGAGV